MRKINQRARFARARSHVRVVLMQEQAKKNTGGGRRQQGETEQMLFFASQRDARALELIKISSRLVRPGFQRQGVQPVCWCMMTVCFKLPMPFISGVSSSSLPLQTNRGNVCKINHVHLNAATWGCFSSR